MSPNPATTSAAFFNVFCAPSSTDVAVLKPLAKPGELISGRLIFGALKFISFSLLFLAPIFILGNLILLRLSPIWSKPFPAAWAKSLPYDNNCSPTYVPNLIADSSTCS